MLKTRTVIISMLKRNRYTAPQLAAEFETSAQTIRYHLKLIKGLQKEQVQVVYPDGSKRLVTEYWLKPSP